MWIKILCIEYILWGIPTIESTFDVANMVKTATVKYVPIKKWCASKHTGLLNSCLGKLCLHPYLVVPLISARITLISTRVSAHCQAILFLECCHVSVGFHQSFWCQKCLTKKYLKKLIYFLVHIVPEDVIQHQHVDIWTKWHFIPPLLFLFFL